MGFYIVMDFKPDTCGKSKNFKNKLTYSFFMLQKIRDLMRIKEEIDSINRNTLENSRIASELKAELGLLGKELAEARKMQDEFLKSFKESMFAVKNLKEDFGREIYEFKLLKGQLQKKILVRFEEELQKDLEVNRENLKKDAEDYTELRKKVNEILSRLNLTGEEMNKFIEISKSLKKEDFELTKFARHLMEMDNEKLELMRKIDALERLVSRIRRREVVR